MEEWIAEEIEAGQEKRGWKPPFTMDEGIRETVKWYEDSIRLKGC